MLKLLPMQDRAERPSLEVKATLFTVRRFRMKTIQIADAAIGSANANGVAVALILIDPRQYPDILVIDRQNDPLPGEAQVSITPVRNGVDFRIRFYMAQCELTWTILFNTDGAAQFFDQFCATGKLAIGHADAPNRAQLIVVDVLHLVDEVTRLRSEFYHVGMA
jgi:hypothetical protein